MSTTVGVEIQYGTKGAKDAENTNKRLVTSFDKMKTAAGTIGVVGNQYLELGKKVYEGAKAFYEFAKAGAKTSEAKREFISFEANLTSTKDRIQEMTAASLANSGVMDSLSGLISTFTSGLGEGTAAGGLFMVALRGIFEVLVWGYRPIQLTIEGINWLGNELGITEEKTINITEEFKNTIKTLQDLTIAANNARNALKFDSGEITKQFKGEFTQKEIDNLALLVKENKITSDQIVERIRLRTEDRDAGIKILDEIYKAGSVNNEKFTNLQTSTLNKAAESLNKFANIREDAIRKGKAEEEASKNARQQEKINLEALMKTTNEYLYVAYSKSSDEIRKYLDILYEQKLAEEKRVAALRKEIDLRNRVQEAKTEMKLLVEKANLEMKLIQEKFDRERNYSEALKQYRQQEIDEFNRLIDVSSEAQNALGNALGGNAVAGIGRTNKVIKEMYKFIKEGNKSSLETTAQTVGGIAEIASAFMDEGWAKAGFQAAMETGYGIATAFTNPLESVSHFAAAAQFLIAQALAGSKSGKGSSGGGGSSGGSGTATGSGSNVINKQKEGDSSLVIEVDGTILGSITGKSINKASRYGQVQIEQKSIVKSGRRMI